MNRSWIRAAAVLVLLALPRAAAAIDPIYSAGFLDPVAIAGADPVAYFTDGAYVPGSAAHEATWKGATWRFASAAHRAAFLADPERYAPQYGGYCAFAVAGGHTARIDPEAWTVVDGRLYLNYSRAIRAKWAADREGMIARADANWPGLLAGD